MNENNHYHISFFRPTTDRALKNRNKVVWLVAVWAIGVFGFQFLLRALEEPTPEPVQTEFNQVWEQVKTGNANKQELQTFAHCALQVTGKVFIKPEHRMALDNGITWATMHLADSAQKAAITQALVIFEKQAEDLEDLSDGNYQKAKDELAALASVPLGLKSDDLLTVFLPLELRSELAGEFTEANKKIVERAVPLYTTHNQSVLTDTKFLGFPFHYFYTSVFLLILFIAICWFYSFTTDKINRKLQISE